MFFMPFYRGEPYDENLAEIARELIRMGTGYLLHPMRGMNKATVEAIKTGLDCIESTDPNYMRAPWERNRSLDQE